VIRVYDEAGNVIETHRWGWKVFEAPGVEPVFPEKRQAISYAQKRECFRSGEIRILRLSLPEALLAL
jgi:hypothetical protein